MVFSKRKVSLRHLLALLYALTVVLVIALLVREVHRDLPFFSLSLASVDNPKKMTVLSLYGKDFHPGIEGVFARTLVNEDALLWRQLAGTALTAVDIKEDLALVACDGKRVVSIGLHDGESPEILGSIELPDTVKQIKIVGDQALLGMQRRAGFFQIDLTDPRDLKLVRHYPSPGLVTSMVVDRDIVYFADYYQGVGRIDLSAKDSVPEILAVLDSAWRVALQGNKLVVGTISEGVHLFDITQGGQLVEAGHLDYPVTVNVRGVALTDEVLGVALADGTLHLLDLSTWPRLHDAAQLTLPGSPILCERIPGQAGLAVGLIAGGVVLIDVNRPVSAAISGFLKLPRTFVGMTLQADKFYGAGHEGLEAFSLDKIAGGEYSLMPVAAMNEPDHYQLQSWRGHVYGYTKNRLVDFGEEVSTEPPSPSRFLAIAEDQGVSLYEQRENGQVQRVGSWLSMEGARAARFRGNYLYVALDGGLRVLSGTRPEELVVVSELKLPGKLGQLEFLGPGYLLVATREDRVLVIDVNDPRHPVQVASLTLPPHLESINTLYDVLVDGSRVYLSQGAGGVHVVDMSTPSQPELLQIVDIPGYAKNMALYDNLLLVADGANGLFMIDVKNRGDALPIGSLPTPLRVDQIAVANGELIVSSHPGGTMRLPLPQRLKNLQLLSEGEMIVDVQKIEKGQYVYLYDERTSEKISVSIQ